MDEVRKVPWQDRQDTGSRFFDWSGDSMPGHLGKNALRAGVLVSLAWAVLAGPAQGQSDSGRGSADADTNVGYIDSAVPFSHLQLRFDAADRANRPTRAEFFYPRGGPDAETRVDYEELDAYLEYAINSRFSVFVETPYRFLNPELDPNFSGLSDMNFGCKWAFLEMDDQLATFQLRAYAPTGAASRNLGTGHFSLEPALLYNRLLLDVLALEAELRLWIPIDGTDYAGEVVRYGIGMSYGQRSDEFWLTPVIEFVGWTVLNGKETVTTSPEDFFIKDAGGDTIVNVKGGFRFGYGSGWDVYAGYGRALTGATWYKDIVRVELRLQF
jgi:hypothetical protein